jgi:hypothetical protein
MCHLFYLNLKVTFLKKVIKIYVHYLTPVTDIEKL